MRLFYHIIQLKSNKQKFNLNVILVFQLCHALHTYRPSNQDHKNTEAMIFLQKLNNINSQFHFNGHTFRTKNVIKNQSSSSCSSNTKHHTHTIERSSDQCVWFQSGSTWSMFEHAREEHKWKWSLLQCFKSRDISWLSMFLFNIIFA